MMGFDLGPSIWFPLDLPH